jgi:hypothetical protein
VAEKEQRTLRKRLVKCAGWVLLPPWVLIGALLSATCSSVRPGLEASEVPFRVEIPEPEKPKVACPVVTNEVAVSALSEEGRVTNTTINCTKERSSYQRY